MNPGKQGKSWKNKNLESRSENPEKLVLVLESHGKTKIQNPGLEILKNYCWSCSLCTDSGKLENQNIPGKFGNVMKVDQMPEKV